MAGARRAQQASGRLQVEVELRGMHNVGVDDRARRAAATVVDVAGALREHANAMEPADNDECEQKKDDKLPEGTCKKESASQLKQHVEGTHA